MDDCCPIYCYKCTSFCQVPSNFFVFNCGHILCNRCITNLSLCTFCNTTNNGCIKFSDLLQQREFADYFRPANSVRKISSGYQEISYQRKHMDNLITTLQTKNYNLQMELNRCKKELAEERQKAAERGAKSQPFAFHKSSGDLSATKMPFTNSSLTDSTPMNQRKEALITPMSKGSVVSKGSAMSRGSVMSSNWGKSHHLARREVMDVDPESPLVLRKSASSSQVQENTRHSGKQSRKAFNPANQYFR